jgi:hypothetical protein
MTERSYGLGALCFTVRAADDDVGDAIDRRLCRLRAEPHRSPDVLFDVRGPRDCEGALPRSTAPGRPVYDTVEDAVVWYHEVTDELTLEYRGVRLSVRPRRRRVDIAIVGTGVDSLTAATHPVLTLALLEVSKRFSLYPVHAACVADGDRGVVIAGAAGAGKSTLAVALARAGCAFLSDDIVFVERVPELRIDAFPDEVDLTDDTAAMFAELAHLVGRPLPPDRPKHALRLEEALDITIPASCQPAALVVTRVRPGPTSMLERIGPADALRELAPNVLLTERASSQAHLSCLGALVAAVPCYRFEAGSDIGAAVDDLRALVSTGVTGAHHPARGAG